MAIGAPAVIQEESVIDALYWDLNKIYSSEHSDSPEETRNAIGTLHNAVYAHRISIDVIKHKMTQLAEKVKRDNMWKTKLSVAIHSRFWDKTFVEIMPTRLYKTE